MEVTVEVAGEDTHEVAIEDPTYDDLVRAVDLNPHEVSVLVDGIPVPGDQPVETDAVTILRLIKGGAASREESPTPAGRRARHGGRRTRRFCASGPDDRP